VLREAGLWCGAILLMSWPFAFALGWMRTATSRHWALGALVASGCMALMSVGLYELHRRQDRISALRILFGTVLLIVLMASVVCGWWSYLVWRHNPAAYQADVGVNIDRAVEHYLWLFWDLLPGLKVTETLNWPAPLKPTTLAAGLPMLAFRVLFLFGLLNAVRKWWTRNGTDRASPEARGSG
jgi:hypothetical protein